MIDLNIHLKSGKVATLHLHGEEGEEYATRIMIGFSDWACLHRWEPGPPDGDAPAIDHKGIHQHLVIPFESVEYLERT